MIGISVIVLGLIAAYTGFTGRGTLMIEALRTRNPDYPNIPFTRFVIGLIVSSLPLLILKDEKQADTYIVLMLLALTMSQYRAIEKFGQFVSKLGGK